MTWNTRLTHAREAAGLTKSKLAVLVGVSPPTVTDWESGAIASLSAENLLALCDVLHMTPHWLMRGEGLAPGEMLLGHDLGERIRAARVKKGLTQEKLADALGVSKAAVSQWESNATCPRKEYISALAEILGVTINWLQGRDNADLETLIRQQTHLSGMGLVSRISTVLSENKLTQGHIELMGALLTQLALSAPPAPTTLSPEAL